MFRMLTCVHVTLVISLAFAAYTLIGYPLLLAVYAYLRSRPIEKSFVPRPVTILLAVRNGDRWLRAKLESLLALRYPRHLLQIVVISDGSTDRTDDIAREFSSAGRIEFLRITRGGKAQALNAGITQARGEIVFFTDVRQKIDPDSLYHLVSCFSDPSVGVASGELVIRDGRTSAECSTGLYWKYEKWMRKRESQIDSMMGASGCIYAMRRELVATLPAGVLADDMYLPLGAFIRGYRIVLEEDAKAFDEPTSLNVEFRRKVRTLAGVYEIVRLYPELMSWRNRMWIAFVSHKLARLLLPYAFLLTLLTSLALPGLWRTAAIALQAVSYGLALADWCLPQAQPFSPITSPLRGFLVMMIAALCATPLVPRRRERLWKESTPVTYKATAGR